MVACSWRIPRAPCSLGSPNTLQQILYSVCCSCTVRPVLQRALFVHTGALIREAEDKASLCLPAANKWSLFLLSHAPWQMLNPSGLISLIAVAHYKNSRCFCPTAGPVGTWPGVYVCVSVCVCVCVCVCGRRWLFTKRDLRFFFLISRSARRAGVPRCAGQAFQRMCTMQWCWRLSRRERPFSTVRLLHFFFKHCWVGLLLLDSWVGVLVCVCLCVHVCVCMCVCVCEYMFILTCVYLYSKWHHVWI